MIGSLVKRLVSEKTKQRIKTKLGVPSQSNSLERIKRLGFSPQRCLDIGAYEGIWTVDFKDIFPGCAVLMIEGQTEKKEALEKIRRSYPDVDYNITLLGAKESSVTFNKYETASSVLTEHHSTNAATESRTLKTLDSIVATTSFARPDFIKIDTQGYELEILKGAETTMQSAEFILLEVSFLDIYKNCPLIADVLSFMQSKGFVAFDICTLMNRPLDGTLFQADFLFVKENSRFRSDKRWI